MQDESRTKPIHLGIKSPIFHATSISNIESICANGGLLSKNKITDLNVCVSMDMSNPEIQCKRHSKMAPNPPGGKWHDYVPFYFAPRSPLMYGFARRGIDCNRFVYIYTTIEHVVNAGLDFFFTDKHPLNELVRCWTDLEELSNISWSVFFEEPTIPNDGCVLEMRAFGKYFFSNEKHPERSQIRMAEFLVKNKFPLSAASGVAVQNELIKKQVCEILNSRNIFLNVSIIRDWYF